jgi:hypothetical protein
MTAMLDSPEVHQVVRELTTMDGRDGIVTEGFMNLPVTVA